MVISLRHFIITITSIFLSLGIGIFIGAIMDSQHLFIEQQKQLVSQIEDEFDSFKEKNYELLTEIESYKVEKEKERVFIKNVYNHLIKSTIDDLNVLIVNFSDEDNPIDIYNFMKDAKVRSVFYTKIDVTNKTYEDTILNDRKNIKEVSYNNNLELIKMDLNEVVHYFNREKNNGINKKNNSLDYIIIFDGIYNSDIKERKLERKSVVNMLSVLNTPIIVSEKTDSVHSYIGSYKKIGISSVDNINTYIGKISLLLLLNGDEGSYGEKDTADRLMPTDFSKLE